MLHENTFDQPRKIAKEWNAKAEEMNFGSKCEFFNSCWRIPGITFDQQRKKRK